ncbi:MAG: hypothetical protein GY757_14855 [bacterium]|nr:hypothetical protein [bacterium]
MKYICLLSLFVFVMCVIGFNPLFSQPEKKSGTFPVLKGSYLGQKAPGTEPELFAPGIISLKDRKELNSVFSPKGDEFYFSVADKTGKAHIMYSKIVDGVWTKPEILYFSKTDGYVDMAFSPSGNRLYYCSTRPAPWNDSPKINIWYTDRQKNGWSKSVCLKKPLNSDGRDLYPIITTNGNMYFCSSRKGNLGIKDIYMARWENGTFSDPLHLSTTINSEYSEGDTYVSPDESYMIVASWKRPGNIGIVDLYIAFRKKNGAWTPLKNMGKPVNTEAVEYCPMVSPDGKYFFFTRTDEIYWMSAGIIEKYRPPSSAAALKENHK